MAFVPLSILRVSISVQKRSNAGCSRLETMPWRWLYSEQVLLERLTCLLTYLLVSQTSAVKCAIFQMKNIHSLEGS